MFNETITYKRLKNQIKNNFPEMIIVHHSGGTQANPLADTSHHTANGMEVQHLSLGWDGLGYHYVIHKDGQIWMGRPEHRNGAHTVDYNTKSIGICLSGNFDLTLPSKEQENTLPGLIQAIKSRYTAISNNIFPHRKFSNKTCYGERLSDDWAKNLSISEDPKEKIRDAIAILQTLL